MKRRVAATALRRKVEPESRVLTSIITQLHKFKGKTKAPSTGRDL